MNPQTYGNMGGTQSKISGFENVRRRPVAKNVGDLEKQERHENVFS